MRIIDYIDQGGFIMYILLLLNIVGFAIMIMKFLLLNKENTQIEATAGRIGETVKGNQTSDSGAIIELTKQEVNNHMNKIEKGLNTVKIIASISPLLGLLGTVLGVLIAFRVMSETGLNNPSSFAKGISMALITTVGGMIVAIPHFIGHSYILGLLDRIEIKLEKEALKNVF